MVKDHSEREENISSHNMGLFLSSKQQVFFYMHHLTDMIAHTIAFVTITPVVEHWLEHTLVYAVETECDKDTSTLYFPQQTAAFWNGCNLNYLSIVLIQ